MAVCQRVDAQHLILGECRVHRRRAVQAHQQCRRRIGDAAHGRGGKARPPAGAVGGDNVDGGAEARHRIAILLLFNSGLLFNDGVFINSGLFLNSGVFINGSEFFSSRHIGC